LRRLALALTIVALTATPSAAAESPGFAEALTFEGVEYSREEVGEMKARALLTSVTLCEFAKYVARDDAQPGPRLLVLRFSRKLSVDQLRQVFRGVVQGRSGYSDAELETFLGLLPAVKSGSLVQFRSDTAGKLAVFTGGTLAGSVVSPGLASAIWAGLAGDG
jgi:hypothetical protein